MYNDADEEDGCNNGNAYQSHSANGLATFENHLENDIYASEYVYDDLI